MFYVAPSILHLFMSGSVLAPEGHTVISLQRNVFTLMGRFLSEVTSNIRFDLYLGMFGGISNETNQDIDLSIKRGMCIDMNEDKLGPQKGVI